MVLLCAAAGEKTVDEFASNEAIQCTEIYEFVQKLGNQEYEMPTLQVGHGIVKEGKVHEREYFDITDWFFLPSIQNFSRQS